MEKAGAGIARAIRQFFPSAGKCIVFAGKGITLATLLSLRASSLRKVGKSRRD